MDKKLQKEEGTIIPTIVLHNIFQRIQRRETKAGRQVEISFREVVR
jgi:hypothetical protein